MMESMRNLHIVLFIGVMCVVQTMSQLCPYSDPGGNITSISNNSLPPGLTSITVNGHPLTNLSEDAFDTSAATLQAIYFRYAHLNSLPPALKKLTRLTSLTIQYAKIQDWDTATLKQIAKTLKNLQLTNVGLSSWPSWIVYVHLLRYVDLSSNSLYSIPDDAFSSIKDSMTNLDLSSTGLTHVPQALSTLTRLTYLYLDYNNFTDVSEIEKITKFPFAQKLSKLILDSCGMSRIANFSNLTSLVSISLRDNEIVDVPAGLLPVTLTSLYLSQNSLSSVPKVIVTMSRLSYLFIDNNLITDIEPNSFPSSLTYLGMDSNKLNIITSITFRNLNLLETLNLNYNPISTISPEAFSDLVSLQDLYIYSSQMKEIPLALARLNSLVRVQYSTTQPLACPCPVSHELVQWVASLAYTWQLDIDATCSNGESIVSYLMGLCDHLVATL